MSNEPNPSFQQPERLPSRAAFEALRKAADTGNPEAVAELNRLLDRHPEIWTDLGDVSRRVELEIILAIGKGDALVVEATRRRVEAMRAELAGEEPSPMERLLLDRFIVCWLQSHHLDLLYPTSADSNARLGRLILARKDTAQRQLDGALKAFQAFRKSTPSLAGSGKPSLKIHSA